MTFDPRKGFTSASNAAYDAACPGRHLAQAAVPPEERDVSGKYADIGGRVHAALAGWIQPQTLTFQERELFDACRELEKKAVIDYFGEQPPTPIRVMREAQDGSTRLWTTFFKEQVSYQHSGQPDVVFRSGTRALIAEYKTGGNEVPEPSSNMQLRDQAVLVYGNHTLLEEVATVVIQPLVSREIQLCAYDKESLPRAEAEMRERIIASNNPNSPRRAGADQCAFCAAKTRCVEYQKFAGQLVPVQMMQVLEVPMANWTPEQLSAAAGALGPAQKLLDDIKEFIKAGLKENPGFCPGFTLRKGATVETISDPQACFDRFAALGGKLDQFMRAIKVNKTKLAESVHEVTGAKGKALDKKMSELSAGIVSVKENEPSLVKAKEGK